MFLYILYKLLHRLCQDFALSLCEWLCVCVGQVIDAGTALFLFTLTVACTSDIVLACRQRDMRKHTSLADVENNPRRRPS